LKPLWRFLNDMAFVLRYQHDGTSSSARGLCHGSDRSGWIFWVDSLELVSHQGPAILKKINEATKDRSFVVRELGAK